MGLFSLKGTLGSSSMVLGKVDSNNRREGAYFKLSSLCSGSVHYQFLYKDREILKCRKGRSVIVATGPAIEAPVIATEPLTKDDLIDYMLSGCKPKEKWRIGTEHEKFGFEFDTLRPIKYKQISPLLNGIAERFHWDKIMEGDNIIGIKTETQAEVQNGKQRDASRSAERTKKRKQNEQRIANRKSQKNHTPESQAERTPESQIASRKEGTKNHTTKEENVKRGKNGNGHCRYRFVTAVFAGKQSISLEPGGQIELSGAPFKTLHETYDEINLHLYQAKTVAEEMGIGFMGLGFQPKWRLEDIPRVPKVNLDFGSEADMIKKMRASLALQPLATALFSNSPFKQGAPNGYVSFRSHVNGQVDKCRTGMLPFVFYDTFGFEQFVDYALDVPMIFAYRKNKYIPCGGMSFRDFMAGKLPAIRGQVPTISDWENHLTTIFPEVRLKKYMEMRGADGGPLNMLCALPAFWVGLLYDEVSLHNVLDMIADWTDDDRQYLRNQVPFTGLKTPFQGRMLQHVAEDVLKWAKDGLDRRCLNETIFLDPLIEVVGTGMTPAEKLLEMYNNKWGSNIDPVFRECCY